MKFNFTAFVIFLFSLPLAAQVPIFEWANISFGNSTNDFVEEVATDQNGNVIEVGHFMSSTFNIQGQILNQSPFTGGSHDYADIYIAKYDSQGILLWTLKSSGNYAERALSVATDSDGNIIIAGYYNGDLTEFGTVTVSNPGNYFYKAFLLKISPSGQVIWLKTEVAQIGSGFDGGFTGAGVSFYSTQTDQAGNIYVGGEFLAQSLTVGGFVMNNNPDTGIISNEIFLAKYDPDGNVIWAKSAQGGGFEEMGKIDVDDNGNLYVCASSSSSILSFGIQSANHPGIEPFPAILTMKISTNGVPIWIKRFGGNDYSDFGNDITVDAAENVYITGEFRSTDLHFGNISIQNNYTAFDTNKNTDAFIAKYNSAGIEQWIRKADTDNLNAIEESKSIVVDGSGCLYVAGTFTYPTTIGGTPLINYDFELSTPPRDIFIAKYNSDGTFLWVKTIASPATTLPKNLSIDNSGNLILAGEYRTSTAGIILDEVTYTVHPDGFETDPFIAKLNASQNDCGLLAINEFEEASGLKAYPNPSNDIFNIEGSQALSQCKIVNSLGQVLQYIQNPKNSKQLTVDLTGYAPGIYFLVGDESQIIKLLKK